MAKRRRLEAPSAEDLNRIEEEFRRETPAENRARPNLAPPIAQVAAAAASVAETLPADTRAQLAKADRFDAAEAAGLLIQEVPLDAIQDTAIVRDRAVLDPVDMAELRQSIAANGLRLPIEIFPLEAPVGQQVYGLLSGYRRLRACRDLAAEDPAGFGNIRALVRPAKDTAHAFAAMVEENEIRAQLTHFERGRIAVIAAQTGAFETVEAAVAAMFPQASKAKRSKIRSFALIHEELGDLLGHAEALREKDGLQLAAALRGGATDTLRGALESDPQANAGDEWTLISGVIEALGEMPRDAKRGGRPTSGPSGAGGKDRLERRLPNGVTLVQERDAKGYVIRVQGDVSAQDMVDVLEKLAAHFE